MSDDRTADVKAALDRVLELDEELETAGHATVDTAAIAQVRAVLHKWVDGVKGVAVNPALGRVTLIHDNGRQSGISSPDLPFLLSAPLNEG